MKSNPVSRANPSRTDWSCSTAALFHTLFTSSLRNVFAQRQLVIYLNVARAEAEQRRSAAHQKSSPLYPFNTFVPRGETHNSCVYVCTAKDILVSWVTHADFQCLMPLWWENDTTCCEKCCSRSDEYKKPKYETQRGRWHLQI